MDLELRNLGARNINVGVLHRLLTSCCHRRLSETVQNKDQMGGKKTKDGKHVIHSFIPIVMPLLEPSTVLGPRVTIADHKDKAPTFIKLTFSLGRQEKNRWKR